VNDAFANPQSVLVLGATSEIAQTIVRRFVAGRTRRVVLACRRPDTVAAFADELTAAGATVQVVAFDADATADHRRVLDPVFDAGDIDVTVMAFAVLGDQRAFDADPAAATAAAHTNFTGSVINGQCVEMRAKPSPGCLRSATPSTSRGAQRAGHSAGRGRCRR